MTDQQKISQILRSLVHDLVLGNISLIVKDGRNGRLTEEEVVRALEEYPGKLTMPPESAFEGFDLLEIENTNPPEWSIDFDLWYDDSQSDLTLIASVVKKQDGIIEIAIDDIHVL